MSRDVILLPTEPDMSDSRLNKSRLGRASRLGGMAAGAAARQLGTRIANTRRTEEDAQEVVGLGDLGYWPPGHAFCIFFGPTPMSRGDEIRPASPVNVVGHVDGDARLFRRVASGARVTLERVTSNE